MDNELTEESKKEGMCHHGNFSNTCPTCKRETGSTEVITETLKEEQVPSIDDVRFVIESMLQISKYDIGRRREDERGMYLWEITVLGEHGHTEYSYMRKGRYPEGKASETAIHVVFFDEEGFPTGGNSVAKYIDGEWKLTP